MQVVTQTGKVIVLKMRPKNKISDVKMAIFSADGIEPDLKGYVRGIGVDVFGTIVSKENNTGALARLYVNLRVEYLSDDKWELGTIVPSSTLRLENLMFAASAQVI